MFSITSFALSKLNNAEFVGYFANLNQAIEKVGTEKLGLGSELMREFSEVRQKLTDQVYTTPGSEYTAAMKTADANRDQIFKRIYYKLLGVLYAADNSDLLACRDVVETNLLKKYSLKVCSMAMHEETAVLQGFVLDCKNYLDEDAIDALSVMSDITALEMANNAFLQAYNARSEERAAGDSGLTVKLRAQMMEINGMINLIVQYVANSTDAAMKDKAEACQGFIAVVNAMLADAKKRWNQRNGVSGEEGAGETQGQEQGQGPAADAGGNGGGQQTGGGSQSGGDGPIDNGSSVIF